MVEEAVGEPDRAGPVGVATNHPVRPLGEGDIRVPNGHYLFDLID
jgi:hypothetical protein